MNKACVVFTNSGEIDIAAVTTLGVSVKVHDSPIGLFGTGLKYSIAVALREGLGISICSGEDEYEFCLRERRIRGEHFQIVHMRKILRVTTEPQRAESWQSLHFTTSYGRNWTLENVYRELWSNMRDERGWVEVIQEDDLKPPLAGQTQVILRGERFVEVHYNRWDFLLNYSRRRIAEHGGLEIYAGGGRAVFYRGIKALELAEPSLFTYNIIREHNLTEDRTLVGGSYYLNEMIKNCALHGTDKAIIKDILLAGDGKHERGFHFSSLVGSGPTFIEAVREALKENPTRLNSSAGELYFALTKVEKLDYEPYEPSSDEKVVLFDALQRIRDWGFDYGHYGFTVKVVEFAGEQIIARVNGKSECILTRRALDDLDLLEHALIEEFIHMRDDVHDNTRQMQNALFREIVRLGRALERERVPLAAEVPAPPPDDDSIPF